MHSQEKQNKNKNKEKKNEKKERKGNRRGKKKGRRGHRLLGCDKNNLLWTLSHNIEKVPQYALELNSQHIYL